MTHLFERTALILLAGAALSFGGVAGAPAQPAPDIPIRAATDSAVAAPGVDAFARSRSRGPRSTYTVKRGDTLAEIADRLNVTTAALAKANGLKSPYRLQPGRVLKNPAVRTATASKPSGSKARTGSAGSSETYTVRSGDTLFGIANRFGVSVEQLKRANGLGRSSAIARGRKLTIPGAAGAETAEDDTPAPEARATTRRAAAPDPAFDEDGDDRAAAGRIVTIETAGKAYRVRRGDTLDKVARRLDSSVGELARINKLKRPYRLRAGQTLRGPGGSAKAYVVARGDTLAEVAQRFNVSAEKLRTTNGLRRGASLSPGRRLRLPAGFRDTGPVRDTQVAERPRSSFDTPPGPPRSAQEGLPATPQPYNPTRRPPAQTYSPGGNVAGAPTASPPVSDAQITQMGRGVFEWPVRGQILSGFGDKGTSQRNDGLNIRANTGDAVRAAAAGDVVYAGDQVPGFGNLVLIKHADGWVTAYGHLGKVGVRMQQKVTQGQEIGEAGSTGGVSEPQLHFEVRYAPTPQERARPIDPALVLPR